jgi:hypothetical protein
LKRRVKKYEINEEKNRKHVEEEEQLMSIEDINKDEKIMELELEIQEAKDINNKLTAM